jgi:c-di-GMP-related signal transduction protein
LVKAYEKGDWESLISQQTILKLRDNDVADSYVEAIKWAHQVADIY